MLDSLFENPRSLDRACFLYFPGLYWLACIDRFRFWQAHKSIQIILITLTLSLSHSMRLVLSPVLILDPSSLALTREVFVLLL